MQSDFLLNHREISLNKIFLSISMKEGKDSKKIVSASEESENGLNEWTWIEF
jgi:hypothetical protein